MSTRKVLFDSESFPNFKLRADPSQLFCLLFEKLSKFLQRMIFGDQEIHNEIHIRIDFGVASSMKTKANLIIQSTIDHQPFSLWIRLVLAFYTSNSKHTLQVWLWPEVRTYLIFFAMNSLTHTICPPLNTPPMIRMIVKEIRLKVNEVRRKVIVVPIIEINRA